MKRIVVSIVLITLLFIQAYGRAYYDHVCKIGDSYGNQVEIYYDGDKCGTSTNWVSYKKVNGRWVNHNDSETYGELNVGDFSCCNPV